MKRLVIFDFDGTIFNSVDDVFICFNKALVNHNFPTLTKDEFYKVLGGNIDEMVSLILKDLNTPENMELIKDTYGRLYNESSKENSLPFPNIHEVLRKLQDKGMFIAINSNRKNDSINYFVDRYFNDIDFAAIEGHNPAYPSKPSPCGVEIIMEKLDVSKEESIYIGDSSTDIKTAQNAEIDCIIVKWGYGNQDVWQNDYIIGTVGSPCEILNYF